MSTPREAERILNHYFEDIYRRLNLEWGDENREDIARAILGLARGQTPSRKVPTAPRPTARLEEIDQETIRVDHRQTAEDKEWLQRQWEVQKP
jgi:hypothetical protein